MFSCKIFITTLKKEKWSNPQALPSKINEKGATTTHPNIAKWNDKEYIFFSSNRSSGEGNMDIWYCEILDGSTYGKVINLGSSINTPDPEITPFFHTKTKTLYFSSSWHNGFGGFDIFKSSYLEGSFGIVENLFIPVNSSWNDMYYWLDQEGNEGFLTSNRLGIHYTKGPTCCNDIWSVKINNPNEITDDKIIKTLDDLNKYDEAITC